MRAPFSKALLVMAALLAFSQARAEALFRVCADPDNLPYSNSAGAGFENKLAELLAQELGEKLTYEWRALRRGFVRNTLNADKCDVMMSVPVGYDLVETTNPYYRSSYVLVWRADRNLGLGSLKDPQLKTLTVGVELLGENGAMTPPVMALAKFGVVSNVRGYMVYRNEAASRPNAVGAVATGEVDVAAVWGPSAAQRQNILVAAPIGDVEELAPMRFAFDIALGLRRGDKERKQRLNEALARRAGEIHALLVENGVPLLSEGPPR
jgi:quinoprotein dehydrogenase-associated probable ABC transporter substrate-binding protein